MESCKNLSKTYNIYISKPEREWQKIDSSEFEYALSGMNKDLELGIFARMDMDKKHFYFDLVHATHLFVASTTGNGKSAFLNSTIVCLLRNKEVKMMIIYPKRWANFKEFENMRQI